MKIVKLPVITLILISTLAGCSTDSKSDKFADERVFQIKILEYEKCLTMAISDWERLKNEVLKGLPISNFQERLKLAITEDFQKAFNSRLEACKPFKP